MDCGTRCLYLDVAGSNWHLVHQLEKGIEIVVTICSALAMCHHILCCTHFFILSTTLQEGSYYHYATGEGTEAQMIVFVYILL